MPTRDETDPSNMMLPKVQPNAQVRLPGRTMHKLTHEYKRRPYWHVDAKWLFSLILLIALGWWLLVLAAYKVTGPITGPTLTANVLAYGFSQNGLDNGSSISQLAQFAQASPTRSIQPIAGFPVTISLHDLQTLSPIDVRLQLFKQIAQPLYEEGTTAYARQLAGNPSQQQKFEKDASLFRLATKQSHQALGRLAVFTAIAVLALLVPVLYFSAGFGRLVTPAVILLPVSLPGVAAFTVLRSWSERAPAVSTAQVQNYGALLDASKGALTPAFSAAQSTYLWALYIAAFLLAGATFGKLATLIRDKSKKSQASAE